MSKEIIINHSKASPRIAIVEDNELSELYIENAENTRTIGDIYLARVRNLMPGIQAAFVDIGQKQDAFLHFSDIDDNLPDLLRLIGEKVKVNDFPVQPRLRRRSTQEREDAQDDDDRATSAKNGKSGRGRSNGRGRGRGKNKKTNGGQEQADKAEQADKSDEPLHPAQYLSNGQRVLVQITKEPIASKGSRVSSSISLAGRFLVLVPCADYVAVSRKISSPRERRRLRVLARTLLPDGFGLIVRTVAAGRDSKTLDTDLNLLLEKWSKIEAKLKSKPKAPALLYEDVSMVSSVVRDLFTEEYDRILIDDQRLYRSIRNYVRAVAPAMADVVQQYQGKKPIFESVGIADAVAEAFESRVGLPSGGYLYIEHTEAMHVVDVNSGSAGKGKSQEENSIRVNLEAARVIARQLRLRDLGGIIVVDFIDMRDSTNRRKVYDELKRAFKKDRAVTKVLPMSDFGLVQITRQRLRPSITRDEQLSKEVAKAKEAREARRAEEEAAQREAARAEASEASDERASAADRGPRRTPEEMMEMVERLLDRVRKHTTHRAVALRVHPFTAAFLSKGLPSRIRRWAMKYRVRIRVDADTDMPPMTFELQDPETGDRLQLTPPRDKSASKPKGAARDRDSAGDRDSAKSNPGGARRAELSDAKTSE